MSETWRDVAESWEALINLRAQLTDKRGQAVLECICSDDALLHGIGAAEACQFIRGSPPDRLLILIKEGPGSHIRQNAFRYRKMIDREIVRVRRLKEVQLRSIALIGSGIIAALIGLANFISRSIYYAIYPSTPPAVDITPLLAALNETISI